MANSSSVLVGIGEVVGACCVIDCSPHPNPQQSIATLTILSITRGGAVATGPSTPLTAATSQRKPPRVFIHLPPVPQLPGNSKHSFMSTHTPFVFFLNPLAQYMAS